MPIIEERQIYQSGRSSFAITLPRGWVRYLRLKPGDKVEVEAKGELTIRPTKGVKRSSQKTRWQNQERLVVTMCHVAAPDGSGRLSRVIDILMKSAARHTTSSKGSQNAGKRKPPSQLPAKGALTGGNGESCTNEQG